jgi:hypothetical protein
MWISRLYDHTATAPVIVLRHFHSHGVRPGGFPLIQSVGEGPQSN